MSDFAPRFLKIPVSPLSEAFFLSYFNYNDESFYTVDIGKDLDDYVPVDRRDGIGQQFVERHGVPIIPRDNGNIVPVINDDRSKIVPNTLTPFVKANVAP